MALTLARRSSGVGADRARQLGQGLAADGLAPRRAALVGGATVVALALGLAAVADHVTPAAEALILVVPVATTAVLGGRRPAWFTASLATLLFLLILPPVGSLRLRFSDDAVALGVFMVVAFLVGGVIAARVEGLGRIERQRTALLRSVSHDLRTPLAAICAGVSELKDDAVHSPSTRLRLLSLVGDEADHLDRLVGNLLSLARLEGGGHVHVGALDLAELVTGCVERLRRRGSMPSIVVDVQPGVPALQADRTLLDQLLTNLIENAVRHSPPDAPVIVSLEGQHRTVRLTVSDAGSGIAPEHARIIFEPFRSGATPGAGGLGLAICDAVAKAHGGTIDVARSPSGGASFVVVLPVR
jgi:K+-sensing histidine kinase KdpD